MATRKPLRELLPEIMVHIQNHIPYMEYNNRLFLVHEGQLRKEIEDSLRKELSPKAYAKAIQRVPSINLLIRIIDKLSRVYSEPVARTPSNEADKPLMQLYEREAGLNETMASANKIFNLHKCVALEPFIQNGMPCIRVLPAHQFLPFSDDPVNPLNPTVFIKFMGQARAITYTDRDGRIQQPDEVRLVQTYYLYSDDEILIIDSDGATREDLMYAQEVSGVNPLGRIPFVYINRSDFRLVPLPDTDTLDNTVLIPKLLADLNYAVQFQSHSVFVATDMEMPADLAIAPDTVWNLKSSEETRQGRIDTIKPTVDIEQVIELIKVTLSMWLESRNIKAGDMGQVSPGDAASGVARIIDESDATQDRQSQCLRFQVAERSLWTLIRDIHNYWVDTQQITTSRFKFGEDFSVSARFGDQKPVVTDRERIETIRIKMESGLMGVRQGLRELYPAWSEDEIARYYAELKEEQADGEIAQRSAERPAAQDDGEGGPN